ncbi:MAG TPA: ribosomal protein S18-alanine N-acetyltransferase [Mycobacteriales bacterium]|nr:ribosomal protein S18-alanine N-acetyltransferase [Mycobacteriales bacterium]
MNAELTALRWWHLPAVVRLERNLFAPEAWSEELFWSELAQGDMRWYVAAFQEDALAGYAGLAVGGPEAYVQTLAVAPGQQRRGLGARLLQGMIAEATHRGARQVGLEVRADNAGAQRLYARHDFQVAGRRRGYYQPSGQDALVMLRDLP